MRKIFSVLLILITVFALMTAFISCSILSDDDTDDGKKDDPVTIKVLSFENYSKFVKLDAYGKITDVNTFDVEKTLSENKRYYAVVSVSGEHFMRARFAISGDVVTTNTGLTLGDSAFFKATYNKNEKAYYIEKLKEDISHTFYCAIEFTVSRAYSGIPLTVSFDYSADAEGEEFECSSKKEVDIKLLRKADVVSSVGYLTESDYQSGNYEDKIKDSIEVAVNEKCYVVFDFEISEEVQINETDTASLEIYAYPGDTSSLEYDFFIESLPTSEYTKDYHSVVATFKIHDSLGEGKKFRFIVGVVGKGPGELYLYSGIGGEKIFFVGGYLANGVVNINADLQLESKLEYSLSSDESYYTVTGLGTETSDTITVPAVHNGLPVKEIDRFVFMDAHHIKKVVLNEGLEKIGASAFKNCSALETVIIPESVTVIGDEAFYGCPKADICCVAEEKPSAWSDSWVQSDNYVTWNSDNVYVLNEDNKSYSFTSCGQPLTDVKILSEYNGRPVTGISDSAFEGCTSLTTVIMPESLQGIGEKAFYGCTSLSKIVIPESVQTIGASAFEGCTSLSSFTTKENSSLTEIGEKAFMSSGITEIILSDSIKTIGGSAFEGCLALKNVYFGTESRLNEIGERVFYQATSLLSVNIPSKVAYICDEAFYGCALLTEISIPDNVLSIGKNAFFGCASLKTVFNGENSRLTKISEKAFSECTALTSVTLGNSLEYIGNYAFSHCSMLGSIVIPDKVSEIGASTFYLCTELTSVTLGEKLFRIGNSAFSGCSKLENIDFTPTQVFVMGENLFFGCTSLSEVILPSAINYINYGAFQNCTSLKSIVITSFVSEIGQEAFSGCTALESVTFTGSYETVIKEKAFYGCTSLEEIVLPRDLVRIEESAFENCTSLSNVTVYKGLNVIMARAFYNCVSLTSICFEGSEQEWSYVAKRNMWDTFDNNGVDTKIDYTLTYNYNG